MAPVSAQQENHKVQVQFCICIPCVLRVCVCSVCVFILSVFCLCVFSTCVCIVCTLCIVCALYNFFHSHLLLQLLLLRDVAGVAAFVTGDQQTGEGLGVLNSNNNNCCLDSM